MTDCHTPKKTYKHTFEVALQAVTLRLETALTAAPPVVRGYTAHLAGSAGKMIRASALLACAQDEQGLIPEDGVRFAAAIELLHLATLVHDDVMDDADTRRGIPTLQKKYGKRTAVICGDYLLADALKLAVSTPDREGYLQRKLELPDYVSRICMGELRQHSNNGNLTISIADYLRIIRGKTAALFEASFYAGAILCTENPATLRTYAALGRHIGMIFQLIDDCIDYDVDTNTAQKPVQSDYEQGVITLPLIHALGSDPELLCRAKAGALGREEVVRAVKDRGGLAYTRWFAGRYYRRAATALERLALTGEKRDRLTDILDKAFRGPQSSCRPAT